MKKASLTTVASVFLFISSFAQPVITKSTAEAGGFSSERLKRLDNKIQEWIDQKWMKGAAALIIHNGKIVYEKGFGYDDAREKNILMV